MVRAFIHTARGTLLFAALVAAPVAVRADQAPAPAEAEVRAARTSRPPVIDGRLNDEVWGQAQPASRPVAPSPSAPMGAVSAHGTGCRYCGHIYYQSTQDWHCRRYRYGESLGL